MHFESVQFIWFATINLIFVLGTKLGFGIFGSCHPLVFVQAMASFGFLVGFASRSKNGIGGTTWTWTCQVLMVFIKFESKV
jgi:hypothetical protein